MAIQAKDDLKNFFRRGARPTGQQFSDLIDSYYHKTDDNVSQGGWYFRSFLNDQRGNDAFDMSGGAPLLIPVPMGATRLNQVRVFGRANDSNFRVNVLMNYISDIELPEFNPTENNGTALFPADTFSHQIVGSGIAGLVLESDGQNFDSRDQIELDLVFQREQFHLLTLQLRLEDARFLPTGFSTYAYYGLEFA